MFPDSWKEARVAPIFKSGNADDRSNYRPISVFRLSPGCLRSSYMINFTSTSFLANICTQISTAFDICIQLFPACLNLPMIGTSI